MQTTRAELVMIFAAGLIVGAGGASMMLERRVGQMQGELERVRAENAEQERAAKSLGAKEVVVMDGHYWTMTKVWMIPPRSQGQDTNWTLAEEIHLNHATQSPVSR